VEWDLAILVALQRDGRLSARELASAIGISKNAAWRRKTNLEERGVILGYRAVIAPDFLGAQQDVVVSVTFGATPFMEAQQFELQVKDTEGVVGLLRVGLNAYWVRVATRQGLLKLEQLVRALSGPVLKFDVTQVMHEIIAYREPPIRRP
jgi:DNA-binding Lrp family transcriptional regulator